MNVREITILPHEKGQIQTMLHRSWYGIQQLSQLLKILFILEVTKKVNICIQYKMITNMF